MKFNINISNVNVYLGDQVHDRSVEDMIAEVIFTGMRGLNTASAGCGADVNVDSAEPQQPTTPCQGPYAEDGNVPDAQPDEVTGFFAEDVATPGPVLDVEPTDAAASVESITLAATDDYAALGDDALNAVAFGENGKNKAKLAWALRRVYNEDEKSIGYVDEQEAGDTLYTIALPELVRGVREVCYGNLYRERDGYAKLGAAVFSTENDARGAASLSNYVATVALVPVC